MAALMEFSGIDLDAEGLAAVVEGSSFQRMKSDPSANFSWANRLPGKTPYVTFSSTCCLVVV